MPWDPPAFLAGGSFVLAGSGLSGVLAGRSGPPAGGVDAARERGSLVIRRPGVDERSDVQGDHRSVRPGDEREGLACLVAVDTGPAAIAVGREPHAATVAAGHGQLEHVTAQA